MTEWKLKFIAAFTFGMRTRLETYEFLDRAIEAGATPVDMIRKMWADADLEKRPIRHVYEDILDNRTQRFSDSIRPYITPLEFQLLNSAESKGDIQPGLRMAIQIIKDMKRLRNAIILPTLYPIILVLLIISTLVGFAVSDIWTTVEQTIPQSYWGSRTESLYELSIFLQSYGIFLLIGGIGFFVAVIYSLPRWHHKLPQVREFMDVYVPPYSVYRLYASVVFLKSVATLLDSKSMNLKQILAEIHSSATPWYQYYLKEITQGLVGATAEYIALDVPLLRKKDVRYIKYVSDDSSRFAESVNVLSDRILEDAIASFQAYGKVAGAAGLFLVAACIAYVIPVGNELNSGFKAYIEAQQYN